MATAQERAWATEFGNEYHRRNKVEPAKLARFFRTALRRVRKFQVKTVLEFGAGDGRNLAALEEIFDLERSYGVEINRRAFDELAHTPGPSTYLCGSILEDDLQTKPADLVLTKGLLIHIARENITEALDKLVDHTKRYLLLCEYYSPRHEAINYRGQSSLCWRGDFAGMLLEEHDELELRDYGFVYRYDDTLAEDDLTWFLLERVS